jgi:hypothetical protein
MIPLHHLLRRSSRAMALGLVALLVVGSWCPRGWFVCLHEGEGMHLVGIDHSGDTAAGDDDDCGGDCCPHDAEGCLDLAVSLVGDLQSHGSPVLPALPPGSLLAALPDLAHAVAVAGSLPSRGRIAESPPSFFVSHVCRLV